MSGRISTQQRIEHLVRKISALAQRDEDAVIVTGGNGNRFLDLDATLSRNERLRWNMALLTIPFIGPLFLRDASDGRMNIQSLKGWVAAVGLVPFSLCAGFSAAAPREALQIMQYKLLAGELIELGVPKIPFQPPQ